MSTSPERCTETSNSQCPQEIIQCKWLRSRQIQNPSETRNSNKNEERTALVSGETPGDKLCRLCVRSMPFLAASTDIGGRERVKQGVEGKRTKSGQPPWRARS